MKKLKFLAVTMIALLVAGLISSTAVAMEPAKWSVDKLSDSGAVISPKGEVYREIDLRQYTVNISSLIYSGDGLTVYGIDGPLGEHLVYAYYDYTGVICARSSSRDQVTEILLDYQPSGNYCVKLSDSSISLSQPDSPILPADIMQSITSGEKQTLALNDIYYDMNESKYYIGEMDNDGAYCTEIGFIYSKNEQFYFADYRTVNNATFDYKGEPSWAFGVTVDIYALSEQNADIIMTAVNKCEQEEFEVTESFYNIDAESFAFNNDRMADAVSLIITVTVFLLIPLAVIVLGVIFVIRRSKMPSAWIGASVTSAVVMAAYITLLVLII